MVTKQQVEVKFWDKLKLEEGWLSLIAVFLAFITVMWSIEGANWVEGSYIITRVGLAGFVAGLALAKIRFIPALLSHAFVVSVGMVFVGIMVMPYADPAYKNDWSRQLGSTILRTVRWGENAILGNARDDTLVYLTMLCFGVWVLGYLTTWLLFRGHRVWWSVSLMGIFLMVNLAFNPPNALASFVFFIIFALILVIRFSAFMDEQRWRSLRLYFQPGLWRGGLVVGAVLTLIALAGAFVTPSASEVESFGEVLDKVSQPFSGLKGFWDNLGNSGDGRDKLLGRSKANFNTLEDSFTLGGPLKLSNEPLFRVSGDGNTQPIYLQAKTLNEYDGKGWISTYQTPATGKLPEDVPFRRLSLSANQSLPTSADKGRGTNKLSVTALIPNFNPVLTLGDMVNLDRPALVAFHYEKVTINTRLDAFKLKEIADGIGGKRLVLVDDTTGKVVPPALLDLVKYLQDGRREDSAYPPGLTLTYTQRGNGWLAQYKIGNGRPVNVQTQRDGSLAFEADSWTYQFPPITQLQALSLQPGGAAVKTLSGLSIKDKLRNNQPAEVDTSVYLSSGGEYVVTIESPLARGNAAIDRFSESENGKKVAAEIKKLQEAVKGNKASYTLGNGRPYSLQYDGYEPNYDDLTAAIMPQAPNSGEAYTSLSRRYRADILSLQTAPRDYPDWVKNRYLQLPSNFSPRIKALAQQLSAGATTNYDKTMALVKYLKSFTYSETPPAAPEGRDEIEFFLFDSKTGYCTYYSSSLAVMLRSIGIPTRIVTGFISGEAQGNNSWLVRGTASHAWTQVYFPGMGWVDFEPTPGDRYQGISRPADPASVTPTPVATPVPAGSVAPNTAPTPTPEPAALTPQPGDPEATPPQPVAGNPDTVAAQSGQFPTWVLWIGGTILLVVGLYAARRYYVKQLLTLPDPSPLTVYNRMNRAAQKAGFRGRSGMTAYEYSTYLKGKLPEASAPVTAITSAYVERRYGPTSPDPELTGPKTAVAVLEPPLVEAAADGSSPTAELKISSEEQMRRHWAQYQTAILNYNRERRIERVVPAFLRRKRPK